MSNPVHPEKEQLDYQILNFFYTLITSNLDNGKFVEEDAMRVAVLLKRHTKVKENSQVYHWLQKCRSQFPLLLKKSSKEIFQQISEHVTDALNQTTTIITDSKVKIVNGKIQVKK